jgi:hypothetical protein
MKRIFRPSLIACTAFVLAAGLTQAATIAVPSVAVLGSADLTVDNDFTRLDLAIAGAVGGDVIEIEGMLDWSEANAYAAASAPWGIMLAGVSDLTITAKAGTTSGITQSDTAAMYTENPSAPGEPTQWQLTFFEIGEGASNITLSGLTMSNGNYMVYMPDGANVSSIVIDDCSFSTGIYEGEFTGGSWHWGFGTMVRVGYHPGGSQITNNTFEVIQNATTEYAGDKAADGDYGAKYPLYPQMRVINTRNGNAGAYDGFAITGNTFTIANDPSRPHANDGELVTNTYLILANNSAKGYSNVDVGNNTFDGGVDIGGQIYRMARVAFVSAFNTGEFDGVPATDGVVSYDGNVFQNCLTAYDVTKFWDPADPTEVLVLEDNTFTNCGWDLAPLPDTEALELLGPAFPGRNTVVNLSSTSTYGDTGNIPVKIKLPITIDGQTTDTSVSPADYSGLYEIAAQEGFFPALDDGAGGTIDAAIYGVEVVEPALVPVLDPTAMGHRFSDPYGTGVDVLGYTVDNGIDPFEKDPAKDINVLVDGSGLLELAPDSINSIATGSVISSAITIRTAGPTKFGAESTAATIYPDNLDVGAPLFEIQAGGSLTIENVILMGNDGTRYVLKGVEFTGVGSLTMTDVTATGFISTILDMPIAGSTASFSGCKFYDHGDALEMATGTTLDLEGTIFDNVSAPFVIYRGDLSVTKSVFISSGTFWAPSPSANLVWGAAGEGNIQFSGFRPGWGGHTTGGATASIEYNWFSNVYGEGVNDDNGVIIGDVDSYASQVDVVAGTMSWVATSETTVPLVADNIVAQFDRDLDALPDAWEIGGVTGYTSFDSDNDGWPDGVEVAAGTNPDDNSDYPAGTFDINADLDDNGYADWYEVALMINVGVAPFIGNVERTNGVGLTDAVRSLQIVNGAFGAKDMNDGDLNALDVTALGPNSLGNPLQILRYQAGVRSKLPALSGVD